MGISFEPLASYIADPAVLALVLGGFVVGVLAVVLGGGLFFSVPLLQMLFPGVSFGAIIGNIKVGSLFRSIGSTYATHKHIEYRRSFGISILAFVGTFVGALLIAHLDQRWLLPATILAVATAELAPRLSRLITDRTFHAASFLTGLYAGVFGAGIGILLVALLRLRHSEDTDIAHVKIQARFVEFMLVIVAVAAHWYQGNLIASIWIPWALGSLAGGLAGGIVLRRMTRLSGTVQKLVLRIAYVVAVTTAAVRF